ncbi:hypothetical protein [Massilia sp. ST3]|uniref:hypothetical protein n=1 Tax=Massilia sp. ST3 TaxID=2824903 RepID=UPI001B81C7A3|nr:hypothetical protein [Massilia sp. ST3]MBQ5949079.1 hypothetical protein [Massilia sp. ST3]
MRWILAWLLALGLLHGCSDYSVEVQIHALGDEHFTPQTWAKADQAGRGRMLASFMSQYPPNRLTQAALKDLLGEPTSRTGRDEELAYLVGPVRVESQYGKGYLLIFTIDRQTGKVIQVRIVPPVTRI